LPTRADARSRFSEPQETFLVYVGADLLRQRCLQLPVARPEVGVDGIITEPAAREPVRSATSAGTTGLCNG
jgi:hypothetical protein